jgi:hypothetical protein
MDQNREFYNEPGKINLRPHAGGFFVGVPPRSIKAG